MKSTGGLPRRTMTSGWVRTLLAGWLTVTVGWSGTAMAQPPKPVSSETALQRGCRTGGPVFGLIPINVLKPEWVSVMADDLPQVAEGVVRESHTAFEDTPAFHVSHDWDAEMVVDPAYDFLNSDKNGTEDGETRLGVEWETAFFPTPFWPVPGDRAWIFGRWIFDCGHPPYKTEIHPPRSTAFTRAEPIIFPGDERPLPSNLTYVYINGHGGYYQSLTVGRNYEFDVPLPPRPAQPSTLRAAILSPPPGAGPVPIVAEVPNSNPPKLHVTYPLAGVSDPFNNHQFGAIIAAAWQPNAPDPNEPTYRQLRVTFDSITINSDHDPIFSGEWRLWLRAGGHWFEVSGLGDVDDGDTKAINHSVELIVPDNGTLDIESTGWEDDCDHRFKRRESDIVLWDLSKLDVLCKDFVNGNDKIGILERSYTKVDGFGIGPRNESSARNGDADTQGDFTLHYRVELVKQFDPPGNPMGNLQVVIQGLSSNLNRFPVQITGPGFSQSLNKTTTLTGLTPGGYTVSADEFTTVTGPPNRPNCQLFSPFPAQVPVTVTGNQTASASIRYTQSPCGA